MAWPLVFPLSLLCAAQTKLQPLTEAEERIERLGMRMRLTGRDMMRLGGTLYRFYSMVEAQIGRILKGSLLWEAGLEDVEWALEDVGSVLGDVLVPILDALVPIIESFADALEASPILRFGVILAIIGIFIGKLIALFQSLTGAINLFFGAIFTARRYGLNFLQALKALWIGLWKGEEGVKAYIEGVKGLSKGHRKYSKGIIADLKKWWKSIGGVTGALKFLTKSLFQLFVFGLLGVFAFVALTSIAEPLLHLFEAIGEALWPIFEPIVNIIEGITDWVEENPELAAGITLIILALGTILLLLTKFGFLGKLVSAGVGKLTGAFEILTGPLGKAGKAAWKNTLANAALVAAIALLIYAIGNFFGTLLGMGVGLWEAVAALGAVLLAILGFIVGLGLAAKMLSTLGPEIWVGIAAIAGLALVAVLLTWALTQLLVPLMEMPGGIANLYLLEGAIIVLLVAFAGLTLFLGAFAPLALMGASVMLILAVAALVFGAALWVAGAGIQLAAGGMAILASNLDKISALIGPMFSLAAAILALGAAGFVAFGGLMLLATAIFALSAALMALVVPLGIIRALGGEGAVVAVIERLPAFQEGGIITRGGVAVVHAGEEIRPAEAARRKKEVPVAPPLTININAPIGSREIAQTFADEIGKILDRRFARGR